VEEEQQVRGPIKDNQLGEKVQEVTINYLHTCGGSSSTQFKMAGLDSTIRLPEFRGEASEDPEKNLFICENIWEAKKITDEDTNLCS
jgi:hypothetical protein